MDNEVSNVLEISVALIAISVVIGIILGTVLFGNQIRGSSYTYLSDVNNDISSAFLKSIEGTYDDIPSAAAYNILKAHGDSINRIECKICKITETGRVENHCIITHLKGNVSLDVKGDSSGMYSVVIHKENCTWGTTVCTCK